MAGGEIEAVDHGVGVHGEDPAIGHQRRGGELGAEALAGADARLPGDLVAAGPGNVALDVSGHTAGLRPGFVGFGFGNVDGGAGEGRVDTQAIGGGKHVLTAAGNDRLDVVLEQTAGGERGKRSGGGAGAQEKAPWEAVGHPPAALGV